MLHVYVLVLNVHIRFMISYKSFRIIIIIGVLRTIIMHGWRVNDVKNMQNIKCRSIFKMVTVDKTIRVIRFWDVVFNNYPRLGTFIYL